MTGSQMPIFLSIVLLIVSGGLSNRVQGAFASARTQAEFEWAVALYTSCTATPAQCWNLVYDPFGVTELDVRIEFATDVIGPGPVSVTGLNNYQLTGFSGVQDLGNNQSAIDLRFSILEGTVPPQEGVNIFELEVPANPSLDRPFAAFNAIANNVSVLDFDDMVVRSVPSTNVNQAPPVMIPVPLPGQCDFDGDGDCDVDDIDMLTMAIANGMPALQFDLSGDDQVDIADISTWLTFAGFENGLASSYRFGDSNLDGCVDAEDLNNVGLSWQLAENRWSRGDFDGSGFVGVQDLNNVGLSWQMCTDDVVVLAAGVPEPQAVFLLLWGIAVPYWHRRR